MSIFKSKKPLESTLLVLGVEELLEQNGYVLTTVSHNGTSRVWSLIREPGRFVSFNVNSMRWTYGNVSAATPEEAALQLIAEGYITRTANGFDLGQLDNDAERLMEVSNAGQVAWNRRRKANRKELLGVLLPAAASTLAYGGLMWALGAAYGRRTAG